MNDVVRDPGCLVNRAGTPVMYSEIANSLNAGTLSLSSSLHAANPGGIDTAVSPLNVSFLAASTRSAPPLLAIVADEISIGRSPNSFDNRTRQRDPPSVTC